LLLRAVGARTRPEAVTADATKPPPPGTRVAVTFDCGEEYEGTMDVALDEKSAMIDFDDGQRENVDFTEGGVRIISGNHVVVRCVALFGDGEETWEISEAAARHAALRREMAEVQAITSMFARGGKYVFQTTTANCERCANCLNVIHSAKSKFHAASGSNHVRLNGRFIHRRSATEARARRSKLVRRRTKSAPWRFSSLRPGRRRRAAGGGCRSSAA